MALSEDSLVVTRPSLLLPTDSEPRPMNEF